MKHLFIALLISSTVFGQNLDSWGVKVSNNITGKPLTTYHQLFYSNFHPGIEAEFNWSVNKHVKHQLYVSGNLGIYYHRFMHTGLKIYPEFNYCYKLGDNWQLSAGLGGGYIHSFENVAVLRLNDGTYEKVNAFVGRPQFMISLDMGASYRPSRFDRTSIVCSIGSFLQGPFVNGYVPLLPYNNFNLGIRTLIKPKAD